MTTTHAGSALQGVSVGIDVGGTFTDLVAIDAHGRVTVRKVATTARDQSDGVEQAIEALGAEPAQVQRVVHGTTVATNMLLERAGARVVLCATAGAIDLLDLRRQERASLYDLAMHHPSPLVSADKVIPVEERLEPGLVRRPLTLDESRRVAEAVATLSPDIVAITLLHAYESGAHERTLAEAIRERMPDVDVVVSADVHPEIREYERTSTTVAEAYLRPGVAGYLSRLGERLQALALPVPGVMLSSGGMRPASLATRSAAALALSGPAGGVIAAAALAGRADIPRALSIDIGGTSADVGLILDGQPVVEPGGSVAGVPIALPRVLVETVSAGGGSVGWIDAGGVLRVGPRSAGMTPGPAAFGRGGTEPTITDAHVVLGNIIETNLSAGITIDAALARRAVGTIATQLGMPVERVADAMISIADAEMARALRRLSVDRGIDPRQAVLIPFGGGGPLHACGLADRMAMTRVLIPPHAGVLSALGLATAPEQRSATRSVMRLASACESDVLRVLSTLLAEEVRSDRPDAVLVCWARSRYLGQGHDLEVSFTSGDSGTDIARRFARMHQERYGFTLERDVEIVSIRCVSEQPSRLRPFVEEDTSHRAIIRGRSVVALSDATLLVADGWVAWPHSTGGWLMERTP